MRNTLFHFIIIIIFISIIAIVSVAAPTAVSLRSQPGSLAHAQSAPKITQETQDQERIEKIKDLVASKVAELKLVEKRGILGKVKNVTNTQITIEDHKKQQRIIDVDELTKFQGRVESFGISDIKTGDIISSIGLYNKETKRLLARFIGTTSSVPENLEGVVLSKNVKEFSITIVDSSGTEKIIDVESSTKTTIYEEGERTSDAQAKKSGFSRIEIGERLIIVGFADKKQKNRISASRVIHFPDIGLSVNLKNYFDATQNETPPSTGSAGKVQPL